MNKVNPWGMHFYCKILVRFCKEIFFENVSLRGYDLDFNINTKSDPNPILPKA